MKCWQIPSEPTIESHRQVWFSIGSFNFGYKNKYRNHIQRERPFHVFPMLLFPAQEMEKKLESNKKVRLAEPDRHGVHSLTPNIRQIWPVMPTSWCQHPLNMPRIWISTGCFLLFPGIWEDLRTPKRSMQSPIQVSQVP